MKIKEKLCNIFESRKNKLKANRRTLIDNIGSIPERRRQQALVRIESRINEVSFLRNKIVKSLSTSKKKGTELT